MCAWTPRKRDRRLTPCPLSLFSDVDSVQLYSHQISGAIWLAERERACLFDEQGLGKTPTAIYATKLVRAKTVLIVAPSIVAWNWAAEFWDWGKRHAFVIDSSSVAEDSSYADVVVVTHSLILKDIVRATLLARDWDCIIIDEMHEFRSPGAMRTAVLYGDPNYTRHRSLVSCGRYVWPLSGTPLPNGLITELWTMFRALFPERILTEKTKKPLGYWSFAKKFASVYKGHFGRRATRAPKKRALIRDTFRGVWLRRLKKDHLELPEKTWTMLRLRPKTFSAELNGVLRAAESLRVDGDPIATLKAIEGSKELGDRYRQICGLAKIESVVDWVLHRVQTGLKCLIVMAWHKDIILGIASGLRQYGLRVDTVTGSSTARKKRDVTEAFQNGKIDFIVSNIKAGGQGVTWTRANEMLFVEMDYVPGNNAQAADRIHRVGQGETCTYRVVSIAGTIDDEILKTLRAKTAECHALLDEESDT